jgi:hypothetical protein
MLGVSSLSAHATITGVKCGTPLESTVRAFDSDTHTVTSTSFVNVPYSLITVQVPDGQTRCLRVKFYVSAKCTLVNPADDHLFFRATWETSHLRPTDVAFTSSNREAANSFEFIHRLTVAGNNRIRMQMRVSPGGTCTISRWVMAVDVAE